MLDNMHTIQEQEAKQRKTEAEKRARRFKVARLSHSYKDESQQTTDVLYHGSDDSQIERHFRSQFPRNQQPHISEFQTERSCVGLITPEAKAKLKAWLRDEILQEEQQKESLKNKVTKALKPKK